MPRPIVFKFGGIVLPNVNTIQRGRGVLADVARTAGGLERSDVVRGWRSWEISGTSPASLVVALERHCEQIMWQYDDFWCLDMGDEAATRARIDASSWHSTIVLGRADWRTISFTVVEQ